MELADRHLRLPSRTSQSFQNTVDIGEARYEAGDIGEGDLLKIKLQLLQFQTDVSAGQFYQVSGVSDLRQAAGIQIDRARTTT